MFRECSLIWEMQAKSGVNSNKKRHRAIRSDMVAQQTHSLHMHILAR